MRRIMAISLVLVLMVTSMSGCMFIPKLGAVFAAKNKEVVSSKTAMTDEVLEHLDGSYESSDEYELDDSYE